MNFASSTQDNDTTEPTEMPIPQPADWR